jgi:hypothetical protein
MEPWLWLGKGDRGRRFVLYRRAVSKRSRFLVAAAVDTYRIVKEEDKTWISELKLDFGLRVLGEDDVRLL